MNNAFGLDIGATSIKAVWLSKQKNGFLLNSCNFAPTPAKGMLSESPLDKEEMAHTIKKAVDDAKITTKNVNLALPENQVYTKVIEMPALSDKELSLAINWEAEQYIPVPLSSISLVWTVLNPSKKNLKPSNNKIQVLVVGAPTAIIDKYQKLLAMCGLNAVAVETEILSVIRTLTYQREGAANFLPSIILSIGAMSTSLALIKDGIVIFTYSVSVGGVAINRAIEADLGLSLMQAEEYKKVYGISKGGPSDKIGKVILPILNSILSEVKKVMIFYSQKYKDDIPIQQIILSGGTAKLPGLDLFFAQDCGIETVIADPWSVLAQDQKLSPEVRSKACDFTVAIGLAMRGYE